MNCASATTARALKERLLWTGVTRICQLTKCTKFELIEKELWSKWWSNGCYNTLSTATGIKIYLWKIK